MAVLEADTLDFPMINQEVDLYNGDTKEVLILADGILVKKQSESRVSKKKASKEVTLESENEAEKAVFVSTNLVLLEKKAGGFEYITSVIDKNGEELLPISDIVKSKVIQEYGNDPAPINVVAISDGASTIRTLFMKVFGDLIVIILGTIYAKKSVNL